jgi:hypothetical protein
MHPDCPAFHQNPGTPRINPMAHDQAAASAAASAAGSGDATSGTHDRRVAIALAQWGNRFTSNGTDYGDFTATLARITRARRPSGGRDAHA